MARHVQLIGTISIANGTASSGALGSAVGVRNPSTAFGPNVDYIIYAPASLTNTINVQVAPVEGPSAGDWKNLSIGGAVVTLAAGTATVVAGAAFKNLRVATASGNEAAQRDFIVLAQVDT